MAYPEPANVSPWYLRNINQALALDSATGNVYIRTGITGNVVITGPVTIPGTVTVDSTPENPVHTHVDEIGTSGILTVPYMPVGGNISVTNLVSITGNINANVLGNVAVEGNVGILGNVTVTQGTNPWTVTGNVRASVTGNVSVLGNVTIGNFPSVQSITGAVTGNVSILGNVTVGNFPAVQSITGNVNASILGNVSASIVGNVNVTQGTSPWSITGNVNASVTGNVNASVTGNVNASVTGNVGIVGNVNIGSLPEVEIKNDAGNAIPVTGNVTVTNITAIPVVITPETATYFQFNNFGVHTNRGWTMDNTQIPMFAVRVKPGSGATGRIGEYELGNNNANQSTIGYVWFEGATITGAAYSWVDIGTSGLQYAIFTDAYGSNTPNGITGGVSRHSGIIIGKNSSAETEIGGILLTDGGPELTIAVQRMDNATKIDLWFAVTIEV